MKSTSNPDAILEGIRLVARQRLELARPIEPSTEIVADLELDSLQQLSLIVEIENHFRICFEPDDEEGICTVGDLMHVIAARMHDDGRPEGSWQPPR